MAIISQNMNHIAIISNKIVRNNKKEEKKIVRNARVIIDH